MIAEDALFHLNGEEYEFHRCPPYCKGKLLYIANDDDLNPINILKRNNNNIEESDSAIIITKIHHHESDYYFNEYDFYNSMRTITTARVDLVQIDCYHDGQGIVFLQGTYVQTSSSQEETTTFRMTQKFSKSFILYDGSLQRSTIDIDAPHEFIIDVRITRKQQDTTTAIIDNTIQSITFITNQRHVSCGILSQETSNQTNNSQQQQQQRCPVSIVQEQDDNNSQFEIVVRRRRRLVAFAGSYANHYLDNLGWFSEEMIPVEQHSSDIGNHHDHKSNKTHDYYPFHQTQKMTKHHFKLHYNWKDYSLKSTDATILSETRDKFIPIHLHPPAYHEHQTSLFFDHYLYYRTLKYQRNCIQVDIFRIHCYHSANILVGLDVVYRSIFSTTETTASTTRVSSRMHDDKEYTVSTLELQNKEYIVHVRTRQSFLGIHELIFVTSHNRKVAMGCGKRIVYRDGELVLTSKQPKQKQQDASKHRVVAFCGAMDPMDGDPHNNNHLTKLGYYLQPMTWEELKPWILIRKLVELHRATPRTRTSTRTIKSLSMIQLLVVDMGPDIFRNVLSYLAPIPIRM